MHYIVARRGYMWIVPMHRIEDARIFRVTDK
jgi:hypothetical protein